MVARLLLLLALALSMATPWARPVTWPGGQSFMVEGSANEWHWQYAWSGSFRWSLGAGGLYHDKLERIGALNTEFVRGTRLLWRNNTPISQANLFGWAGVGYARTELGHGASRHIGFQADYETRRIFTALSSELHEGRRFSHRLDTAAIGVAPYEHDWDRTAFWVVLKGMRNSSALDTATAAVLLRWFTPRWWFEIGADEDRKPLGHLMINF